MRLVASNYNKTWEVIQCKKKKIVLKNNRKHAQTEVVLQNQCFVQMLLICGPLFVCNSYILGVRQSA